MASKFEFKTTPKGVADFPHLSSPDFEFDDNGRYSVKLRLDANDLKVKSLLEELDEALENHFEAMRKAHNKKKIKHEGSMYFYDEENEDVVILNCNMKRIAGKSGAEFEKSIKFFDAKGKYVGNTKDDLEELPRITPGSTIAVNVRLFNWFNQGSAGIRLEPEAVQIVKLAEGRARSAEDYGFDTDDDGYEADTSNRDAGEGFSDESEFDEDDEADSNDAEADASEF